MRLEGRSRVERFKQLLNYIDVDAFLREHLQLFNMYVDEVYESVYKRYTGLRELAEMEPVLSTLTSVKIMYNISAGNENSELLRKGTAMLAALAALVKRRRLDLVKQLPEVAKEVLAKHVLISLRMKEPYPIEFSNIVWFRAPH